MGDWYEEFVQEYEIEEEKIDRMAQVQVSEGGRIELPEPGEELLIYITRNPVKVESEKLKERGIETAFFARCRKVKVKNGEVEIGNVEYDLPISKTIFMSACASLKRAGIEPKDWEGKVFLVTARWWKDAPAEYRKGKEQVKTYVMTYKEDLTKKASGVEVPEYEDEDIEL